MNQFKTVKTGFLMARHIYAASRHNRSSGFPTRFDTNRAVQPKKMARGLIF